MLGEVPPASFQILQKQLLVPPEQKPGQRTVCVSVSLSETWYLTVIGGVFHSSGGIEDSSDILQHPPVSHLSQLTSKKPLLTIPITVLQGQNSRLPVCQGSTLLPSSAASLVTLSETHLFIYLSPSSVCMCVYQVCACGSSGDFPKAQQCMCLCPQSLTQLTLQLLSILRQYFYHSWETVR